MNQTTSHLTSRKELQGFAQNGRIFIGRHGEGLISQKKKKEKVLFEARSPSLRRKGRGP